MPRETPAPSGQPEAERPFAERRDVLFEKLVKESRGWQAKESATIVGRIFEHSIEDGLRLAERLAYTPTQYREALETHGVSFALKHPKVFSALAKKNRTLFYKNPDDDLFKNENSFDKSSTIFYGRETTSTNLDEEGLFYLRVEQKPTRDPVLLTIDDLYLDALTQRYPKLKVHEREGTDHRSKGEALAERYLGATENILEKRFYTGPVKDMFPVLARDPLFRHPTVLETDLLAILKKSHIQAEAALTRLEPARVVAYSQLDAMKRSVAERELVKELKSELPEGKTVVLDREEHAYRVEDEEGADTKQEKPETKSEAERMAAFENKALDELEKLLESGVSLRTISQSLAGLDSQRAWNLRLRLIEKGHITDLLTSLTGLDSKRAWEWRDARTLDLQSLRSIAGVDSPKAWEVRDRTNREGDDDDHLAISLAGLDSERAWRMREMLQPRVDGISMIRSVTGLDSERAWKIREAFWEEAKIRNPEIIGLSLTGLDSDRARKLRDSLMKGTGQSGRVGMMNSLTGLDSEHAWKMRWLYLDKGWDTPSVASSLAGLDSERAWKMRKQLEHLAPDGFAKGLTGDYNTFVWRLNPAMRAKIGMEGKEKEGKKERELTTKERLAEYEEKMLDMMEKLLAKDPGASPAAALAGFDSPRAWKMRVEEIAKHNLDDVAQGLAGLESEQAWKMREELLKARVHKLSLAKGLAGLDSPRAWEMRELLMRLGVEQKFIAFSFTGLDSPKAWEMRRKLLKDGPPGPSLIAGLAGIDSSEAWKIRKDYLNRKDINEDYRDVLAVSLAGLDSAEAWKMRERLLEDRPLHVMIGMAGDDSERAWKLRDATLMGRKITESSLDVLASLTGLDSPRAWQLREALLKRTPDAAYDMRDFVGDYTTFAWRLRKEPFGKSEAATGPWQDKLDLLNLVHNPTLEDIRKHHEAHPPTLHPPELSQHQADVLSELFSDRSAARALLATNAAIPDRAPERLADALFRRMAPGSVREPNPSLGSRLTSAFNALGSDGRPPLTSAVAENPSYQLFGGGSENLADTRTVLEAREAADELLVKGIYGRYDIQKKTWEKIYFPVRRDITGPTKELTLTLTDVAGAGRVSLPLSLDARLIAERVKGVTGGGKEVALEVSLDSLGQASVQVPSGVTRILYSVEKPLAPEPIHDPSPKEFESYLRTFQREHGKDMTAPLARLPHDVEAEVKSRVFQALSPKQKMIRIEALVREVGWYDTRNEEVSREKFGKTPEDHIAITEERLETLKVREKPAAMAGKKFAGVCADFALITATLLRKAGLPAGVMRGIHLTGKTAQMRDMHATAFVPWPDGRGGIRVIAVDGTPQSGEEIAAGIARPSLAELEDQAEQATDAYVAESKEVIEGLLRAAGAHDLDSIRNLKNSKLENALNIILRYEVKQPHLRVVEGLLNAYWYGGLAGKKDRLAQNIQLRGLLETEVARLRSEPAGSEDMEPAGTRLLETTRDFLSKFQRGGAAASLNEAFDLVERVAELAKGELSDVEHRALVAVITYLRAEKMR